MTYFVDEEISGESVVPEDEVTDFVDDDEIPEENFDDSVDEDNISDDENGTDREVLSSETSYGEVPHFQLSWKVYF